MINFLYLRMPFTKIRISISAILLVCALFYADFSVYTAFVLISALLHETGHIILMKIFGVKIYGITVLPFGAVIRSDAAQLSYEREAAVALAGAAVNAVCAVLSGTAHIFINDTYSLFFCVCNLFLAFVNLVPVKTLDGARALEALLYSKMPVEKAQGYLESVSYAAFVFLSFAALALLTVTGCNFSLVMLCVYLFICVYAKADVGPYII